MYCPVIKRNLARGRPDYVDRDTHVHSITIAEIKEEVQENLNTGNTCFFSHLLFSPYFHVLSFHENFSETVPPTPPQNSLKYMISKTL